MKILLLMNIPMQNKNLSTLNMFPLFYVFYLQLLGEVVSH